jgi:hypothetical protein
LRHVVIGKAECVLRFDLLLSELGTGRLGFQVEATLVLVFAADIRQVF